MSNNNVDMQKVLEQIRGQISSTTDDEYERVAFELSASNQGDSPNAVERDGEGYRLMQTQLRWIGWKWAIEWIAFNDMMQAHESGKLVDASLNNPIP